MNSACLNCRQKQWSSEKANIQAFPADTLLNNTGPHSSARLSLKSCIPVNREFRFLQELDNNTGIKERYACDTLHLIHHLFMLSGYFLASSIIIAETVMGIITLASITTCRLQTFIHSDRWRWKTRRRTGKEEDCFLKEVVDTRLW